MSETKEIIVTITFAGYLKHYTGHREPQTLVLPADSSAKAAIGQFEIPDRLIKVVLINGEKADMDTTLQDGDAITLQPLLLGG